MFRRSLFDLSGKLLVLFGSQSGVAESLAKTLGKAASTNGFTATVLPMNDAIDVVKKNTDAKAALYLCSTCGQGEQPTNMEVFFHNVKSGQLPEVGKIPYAIFGLGSKSCGSSYFCAAAKQLERVLQGTGAPQLMETVLSCEYDNADEHNTNFHKWEDAVFEKVK